MTGCDWDGNGQETAADALAQSGIYPAGGAQTRRLQRAAGSCQAPPHATSQSQTGPWGVTEWAGNGQGLPAHPAQTGRERP